MVGLHRSDDREGFIASKIGGVDDLIVLDAESKIFPFGDRVFRRGKRVKSHRDRPVSNGMEADLKSRAGSLDGHLIEGGLIELGNAGVARVVCIRDLKRSSSRTQRTVHEALEHPRVEHWIIGWMVRALGSKRRQRVQKG